MRALELFNAQTTGNTTEPESAAGDNYQDELTAAVLRGKQARLQTLQAILTGLQAKSDGID
jgi:hypothetical protein